jgi:hypothetical protein
MARFVLREFIPVRDNPVATIDALCGAFDKASKQPRVNGPERQLAQLICGTIQLQKQYL